MKINKLLPIGAVIAQATIIAPIITSCNQKAVDVSIDCEDSLDLVLPVSTGEYTLHFTYSGIEPKTIAAYSYCPSSGSDEDPFVPYSGFRWDCEPIEIKDGKFSINFDVLLPSQKEEFTLVVLLINDTVCEKGTFNMSIVKGGE